jgi:hypothetical protein
LLIAEVFGEEDEAGLAGWSWDADLAGYDDAAVPNLPVD